MLKTIQTFCFLLFVTIFCIPSLVGGAENWPETNEQPDTGTERHLSELEFKEAKVKDAIRVIAELTQVNILATAEAGKKVVTLFIRNLTVADAIDSICRVSGLWYRLNKKTKVYVVMTTEEYFKDIIVFREESTQLFTLRYQNVLKVGRLIEAMFGEERVELDLQNDFFDDLVLPGASLGQGGSSSSSRDSRGSNNYSDRSDRYGSGDRYSGRGYNNSFGSGRDGNAKKEIGEMTTEQIALLEQINTSENPLLLSEKTLSSVRRRSRVPIFVSVNREHNLLFVRTADEKAMGEIFKIVNQSDRPTPQVLLEMKVMSITMEDGFRSAFDFSYMGGSEKTGPADGLPPNPYDPLAVTASEALVGFVAPVASTSSMIFQMMNDNIRVRIELLESEGRVKILATPMLLASNNRPAKIFIGQQTVMTTGFQASSEYAGPGGGSGNTYISVPVPETEVVEVGNTLTILPSINSDRTVLMRLLQEASQTVKNGATIPVVVGNTLQNAAIDILKKSTMEGTAMAKDGLTVVIGGMITESQSKREEKVPLLGDIPLLGALFRRTEETMEKEELVLLITPHVFFTPEEAEAVTRQRLGELTDHGDSINIYLDELDNSRLQTDKGRVIMEELADTSTPMTQARTGTPENLYIALIRTAAKEVRILFEKRTGEGGITALPLSVDGSFQLFPQEEVETIPVAEWTDGVRYVAAFKTRNFSNETVALNSNEILGNWQAATLERDALAPTGEENDTTYMYLISHKPLNQAISRRAK